MKYLISVGHTASGNVGCGAVGFLNESNCTREIASLVVAKLKALGYETIKLQIDNSDKYDYVKRTNQANAEKGDIFVEIHLNAGGGTGCEVLTTSGSSASNLASKVSASISRSLNIPNRGHKTTSGLYVLNNTSMPAMLIECCFVDNENDYKAYSSEKIANAIVEGLTGQLVSQTPIKKGEWIKTNNGDWWYKHDDGSYTIKDFELIDGKWYYFDYEGYMITGWLHLTSNNQDYYFYSNGEMAHDCILWDKWQFDSNGIATKIK